MNHLGTRTIVGALLVAACFAPGVGLAAQDPPGQEPERGRGMDDRGRGVAPAELQRLFDAYVAMQAQQQLQLSGEQYPQFLNRLRALQDVRRHGQIERLRILVELRRLTDGRGDDGQIRAQLKALDDLDGRISSEVRQATDAVAQVLDVRQQARFLLLEEQMERRKLELMMRARQANRPRRPF